MPAINILVVIPICCKAPTLENPNILGKFDGVRTVLQTLVNLTEFWEVMMKMYRKTREFLKTEEY